MASPTIRPGHDTPGGDPMTYYEPQARYGHWTALINGKLYTYGGYYPWVPREPPSVVELFDITTELWGQSPTSGPPPPGFVSAACIAVGQHIYHFGGTDGKDCLNTIHEFDSCTLTWKELKPTNPRAAPMCKSDTAMVSFGERYLVTFAGYGPLPEHPHRGAEYIPDPKSKGDVWTNELLVFDTSSRRWSSPETTGSPPPPCSGATFTRVDHHRAVVYGGQQLGMLLPNHIYILDMQSWIWIRSAAGGGPGQPWPVARSYHSAVSLHDPDDPDSGVSDPALMVWGGDVGHGKVGRDAWVFLVNTLQWNEISLPDALRGRIHYTTTIAHCDSTLWKVINIGGVYEWPLGATPDTLVPVLETVIVELRYRGPSGDLVVMDVKFKGRRTPSLGQPWRGSESPLVGAGSLQATSSLPSDLPQLLSTYLPSPFIQQPLLPTPLQPFPQMLPSPGVWSSLSQTSSVGVQQPLPSTVPALYPATPTTMQSGFETSTLPASWPPTIEYAPPTEPTLELFPPPSPYYPFLPSIVPHELPETTPVTVGTEQKEPIPKEKGAVPMEEIKPVMKLEPKQEEESVVAEKKEVARELVQKLLDHKQLLEEKEEVIAKKDEQLMEREEELAKMEKQLAEKDEHLAEKDAQLAEKDVQLAGRDEEFGEMEKQLAEMNSQLTKKEDEMASLAEHSSDLIQMKSQEIEALKAVTTSDYLRGMEVVAGTTFHLTGRRQTHVWEGHGLRLHIPDGALPPDHPGCRVDVRAGLSGQVEFSEGSHPVSGMYWLSCKEMFLLPATLELQHCAVVGDATQCSRLRFAIAKCSQPELPYNFKSLDRGVFTPNSSYGSISLSQFSIVAITEQMSQDGEGSQEPQQPLQHAYCAKLFYLHEILSQCQLDFTITHDLELCHKHVDERYTALSARLGPHLQVQFEEDQISLDIPDHVTVVEGGWKIVPLTPPQITKEQVDNFKAGRRIPTCQLKVVCTQKENPVDLDYKLNLLGARKPYNFMYFSISPGSRAATGEKRRLQQHDDSEQENGHVKRRRSDSESSVSVGVPEPILKDLLKVQACDWYALGLNLGVSEDELDCIEKDNRGDVKTCRRLMFREWLKHTNATYQQLVEALEAIGEETEAARLCKTFASSHGITPR